jgi:hypothetical protein
VATHGAGAVGTLGCAEVHHGRCRPSRLRQRRCARRRVPGHSRSAARCGRGAPCATAGCRPTHRGAGPGRVRVRPGAGTGGRVLPLDGARVGLHGRRAQDARARIRRHQSRLRVPRPARVGRQLRPQHDAGDPDVPPRGIGGGDGARLRQSGRQADARHGARHSGTAPRFYGALPGVGRPRARRHDRRPSPQPGGNRQPPAQRAGHGLARPRLRQVRRRGDDGGAVCRVGDAGVPDRDDAADGPSTARCRCGAAGKPDRGSIRAADSRAHACGAAAGGRQRRARGREAPGRRRTAAHPGAQDRPHAARVGPDAGAGRDAAGSGRRRQPTARGRRSRRGTASGAPAGLATRPT